MRPLKYVSADEAVSAVKSHDHIHISSAGHVPQIWNPKVVAVNSAVQIDLTGQISADSIGTRIISGTGGQLDFVKGATMSEGGKSITAFPSRAKNGQSKIVPILDEGAGVVTPRADAHWVVTEYGAVDLTGLSLQERAKKLISIAHPDDREMLKRAAFERYKRLL